MSLMDSPELQTTTPIYNGNFDHKFDISKGSTIETCKTQSKLIMPDSRFSNKGHYVQMHDQSSLKVKRTLFKHKNSPIQENKSSFTTPESTPEKSSIIYTSSSPFKVTSQDNCQSLTPVVHQKVVLLDTNTKQLTSLSQIPSSSTKYNLNNCLKIKNSLSKHKNDITKDGKKMDEVSPPNNLATTPRRTSSSSNPHFDILNRILNVVLKIRYDVQSIQQKQMEMEQVLTDTLMHRVNENQGSICQDTTKEAEDFHMMIPIMNEEQLFIFEEKLLEKSFKLIVVNELKRLQKKELNSTVRGLLKALFIDDVLKEYSYVGQKKKKIFCSLRSCAVVLETVRKMKNFQNSTNSAIEDPIKKYIAGAGFRKSSKFID